MDTQRIRQLIDQRDAIDAELRELIGGTRERKPQICSICQQPGHSARTCPQKPQQ